MLTSSQATALEADVRALLSSSRRVLSVPPSQRTADNGAAFRNHATRLVRALRYLTELERHYDALCASLGFKLLNEIPYINMETSISA